MAWKKLYIQPNKAAQKAAKRGLEARKKAPKSKKGGLDAVQASMAGVGSGVLRARDIVAGKRVNAYQVNAFFNRHLKNYVNASIEGLKPVESRAIQAWLLWGGEPLRKQAAAAVRKDKAKRNPTGRKFKFDELSEGQKSRLIEDDFKYTRFRFKGDLDDQEVRFDIAKRALRHFERLIEQYQLWGGPTSMGPYTLPEGVLYPFYESGVVRGSWETRFDLPIQGYERIEEVDALLGRVSDQVGMSQKTWPLDDVTAGGRRYSYIGRGDRYTYVPVSAVPLLVQALEILHDTRDYAWDLGLYEVDEFMGHRKRGELGEPPELPPARTYGPFEENPIARSVAKRNRRARRDNPSIPSVFGYEKSRLTKVRFPTPSDAPFSGESMWVSIVQGDENSGIGTIDNDPQFFDLADYGDMIKYGGGTDSLKPVFKSVVECKPVKRKNNPIFDKVPDNVRDPMLYRKARAKVKSRVNVWPSVYASGQLVQEYKRMGGRYINPSIERGGKISYGEYYGLPDGDGGYDLYYRDEIIASGIDTVEQAEEEIAQHIESL